MFKTFRSYQLAKELHYKCRAQKLKGSLMDQLFRASSSICLNLAEGSAKPKGRDRKKFYLIALGSLREVQAIIDISNLPLHSEADVLGAHLYKLIQSCTAP